MPAHFALRISWKATLGVLSMLLCLPLAQANSLCTMGLKVGWDDWAPYHYKDRQGQLQGYAVHVLNEMSKRAACKVVYVQRPWKRTLIELGKGEVHIAMEALPTAERVKIAYFSGPYSPTVIQLLYNTNNKQHWPIKSLSDLEKLAPLRIGVPRGDSFGAEIDSWLAQNHRGIVIDIAPTVHSNLMKLSSNRVDLVFASSMSAAASLRELKLNHLKPIEHEWPIEDAHFAFSRAGVDEATFLKFQAALDAMRSDGTLQRLQQKYRKY
jgi:polar amino acid transport system substrate-binding protein